MCFVYVTTSHDVTLALSALLESNPCFMTVDMLAAVFSLCDRCVLVFEL